MAEKSWWDSIVDGVGGTLSDVINGSSELAEKWASWNIAQSLGFEAASQVSETPSGGASSWQPVSSGTSGASGAVSSIPVWMWAVGAALFVMVVMPRRGR